MKTMVENFINGNLTTAQAQARRYSLDKLRDTLQDEYGYSFEKATRTAEYLKERGSFQAACDAV